MIEHSTGTGDDHPLRVRIGIFFIATYTLRALLHDADPVFIQPYLLTPAVCSSVLVRGCGGHRCYGAQKDHKSVVSFYWFKSG
jgi:hypothetical protein